MISILIIIRKKNLKVIYIQIFTEKEIFQKIQSFVLLILNKNATIIILYILKIVKSVILILKSVFQIVK